MDLLSSREVSRYLSIPLRTIQRLTKQGKIRAIKIGKKWRYKKSDIEQYSNFGTDFSMEPARNPNDFIERRAYPRINCSLNCSMNIFIPDEKKIFSIGRISNISQGGVFIKNHNNNNISNHIRTDDPINLKFDLNENDRLKVNGRVLRIQNGGVAVKFRNIKDSVRETISKYVG